MQIYNGENKQYKHSWLSNAQENPIFPRIYNGVPRLCNLRKKVLFIGANDSMHNSICWQLKVEKNTAEQIETHNRKYHVMLEVPEGGRLLDVADWDEGFEQIYWRHRYERLVESVVHINYHHSVSLSFKLPADDAMLRRIHGIQDTNEMNVPFPTPVPNPCPPLPTTDWQIQYDQNLPVSEQIDCDVRRYIDYSRYTSDEMTSVLAHHREKGYDKWTQVNRHIKYQMPPPPLCPPIYKLNADGSVDNVQ